MPSNEDVLDFFKLFSGNTGGIDSWIGKSTSDEVLNRISEVRRNPLTQVQLNQLLVLSHEAGVSDGFFQYYWLAAPHHPYDVRSIPDFDAKWIGATSILTWEHLRWGLYRLYVDALLYFGSVRNGYRFLRNKNLQELGEFFHSKMYDSEAIQRRGPALPLRQISRDDRYLISEMACKSYDELPGQTSELLKALSAALKNHQKTGAGGKLKIRELMNSQFFKTEYQHTFDQLEFSADEMLEDEVESEADLKRRYETVRSTFSQARDAALQNTRYYLSMVNDLDVYVATSMRTREDFRAMADACDRIFRDKRLAQLHLRYFDPTLSAAEGHEDKGLIECLMVKSAKVLVYSAGKKESYGKDAEAAMALSLGKPVIFLCDAGHRTQFYREVHPLSRLIDFSTGVAGGALVTESVSEASELLARIFGNRMEYVLEQPKPGYYRLKEKLTGSVVRLQTNNELLRETFWNYYHSRPHQPPTYTGIRTSASPGPQGQLDL